jgi:tetratricopeptide (TPR) repeat protein
MQNRDEIIEIAQQAYNSGLDSYQQALASSDQRSRVRQNNLNEAISHYEAALRTITAQGPDPNLWAQIQHALGDAYSAETGPDRVKYLRKAIECYQNCLQVLTYDNWDLVQEALVATSSKLSQQLAQKMAPSALAPFQPLIHASLHSWRWLRARPILLPLLLVVLILAIIIAPLGTFAYSRVASDKFKCVQDSRPLNISGSTALAPLIEKVALQYESKCPGTRINVNQVNSSLQGSLNGLRAVEDGSMDIGLSDVPADATPKRPGGSPGRTRDFCPGY